MPLDPWTSPYDSPVGPKTILNFAQGSFALVESDLARLGEASSAIRAALEDQGVPHAFATRRELVSFKKLCLNHALEALCMTAHAGGEGRRLA